MSKMRVQDAHDSDSDNIPDGPDHFKMLDRLEGPNRSRLLVSSPSVLTEGTLDQTESLK